MKTLNLYYATNEIIASNPSKPFSANRHYRLMMYLTKALAGDIIKVFFLRSAKWQLKFYNLN